MLIDSISDALADQAVTASGPEAAESMVSRHAARICALNAERKESEAKALELSDSLPLLQVLTSMPGIGDKTAQEIFLVTDDFSAVKSSGHLIAYNRIHLGNTAVGDIDTW